MTTSILAVSGAHMASGLAAIRDIGRAGLRVVGASPSRIKLSGHSRWSAPYLELPPPREIDLLLEALRRARVDAMLPMESSYVGALSHYAATSKLGLKVAVPRLEAFLCAYDNLRTIEHCHR